MTVFLFHDNTHVCFTWPDHTVVFVETHHSVRPVGIDDGFALSVNLQRVNNKKRKYATKGFVEMWEIVFVSVKDCF